jgi:hypothetical protein
LDFFFNYSDLISWKRPVLDSKRTNQVYSADSSQQETKLQIKESCNNKESNLERDSTIQTHQTESVTKQDTSVADSVQVNILYSPKSCSQTTNQVESPTRASFSETTQANDKDIKSNESVLSVNTLPPHSSLLLEAHIDEATHNNEQLIPDLVADVGNSDCQKGPSTPEEHYSIPLNRQDYNEHEDEIQLVVSTRNYEAEIQQQEQQQQKAARKVPSPIKPPSRSMISAPTIARHQSSFMSRLFKMTRPSINNSKKDPPLPTDMITTNRPSLNSVKSESTVIPIVTIIDQPSSQDIEVSEFMPTSGPRVKRRKLLVTSPVKVNVSRYKM